MEISNEQFQEIKLSAQKNYLSFSPIATPAFAGYKVYFTAGGWNHLLYKNKRPRVIGDSAMRLKLLPIARKILEISTTLQEKEEKFQDISVRINKKRTTVSKITKYWAFIAIMNNKKIKVIVRQVGEGKREFWSLIPFWKTTKHGDVVFMNFASGNLEID